MKPARAPRGFVYAVAEAAIKKPGRHDLGIICSEAESTAAATFTTNRVKAAPVRIDMARIRSGKGRAVVVNSGNANACTGDQGLRDAREMAALPARALGVSPSLVYVCSTGVIGTRLPMKRVREGISRLMPRLGQDSLEDVARAIMTTDSFPKVASARLRIGGRDVTLAACAKGAGMISPGMATMLCFIMTDASIEHSCLKKALGDAVDASFNRITVDGDMSTNDTVLMLANGLAENPRITLSSRHLKGFRDALQEVTASLAEMIVRDGEGATKVLEIEVSGARTQADAHRAARAIANSLLVKTALYGNDANWGRIMAALGYSGAAVREERVAIAIDALPIVEHGLSTGRDRQANLLLRRRTRLRLSVHLGMGRFRDSILTCDLSEDYVRVNAEYRT